MANSVVRLCPVCGQMVTANEATMFGGRHEDCWIEILPSLDMKRSRMIAACAEACEQHPEILCSMRRAAIESGLADDYL